MDAIVPPNNTSLVTSSDHATNDCAKLMAVSDRISTATENVMNNDNSNAHDAGARAERVGFAGIDHTNQNGVEGRITTNTNAAEARLLVREEGHESRSETRRNADAIERFGLKNLEATKDSLKDMLISSKEDLKNVLISHKDDIKDLLISNKDDFKDILLKNCQMEKDTLLQFKDAQLFAAQNTAAIQASIAECCCENKQLILERANHTDELIRKLDEQRVRDELTKTRDELIALKIRATLAPLPVSTVAI